MASQRPTASGPTYVFYSDPGPNQEVYFAWRQATFSHRQPKKQEQGAQTLVHLGSDGMWRFPNQPPQPPTFPLFPKTQPTEGGVNG